MHHYSISKWIRRMWDEKDIVTWQIYWFNSTMYWSWIHPCFAFRINIMKRIRFNTDARIQSPDPDSSCSTSDRLDQLAITKFHSSCTTDRCTCLIYDSWWRRATRVELVHWWLICWWISTRENYNNKIEAMEDHTW